MKPRIKAKQTTRCGLPSYDYNYGYDGVESTDDLIAMRFIREIASENDSSSLKELVRYESPEKQKPADNQTGIFWRWMFILAFLAFLGSLAVEIAPLCW